jgi:hypothetical protein
MTSIIFKFPMALCGWNPVFSAGYSICMGKESAVEIPGESFARKQLCGTGGGLDAMQCTYIVLVVHKVLF